MDIRFEWDEEKAALNLKKHKSKVLVVCHCYRENEEVIRIISARKADDLEIKQYGGQ